MPNGLMPTEIDPTGAEVKVRLTVRWKLSEGITVYLARSQGGLTLPPIEIGKLDGLVQDALSYRVRLAGMRTGDGRDGEHLIDLREQIAARTLPAGWYDTSVEPRPWETAYISDEEGEFLAMRGHVKPAVLLRTIARIEGLDFADELLSPVLNESLVDALRCWINQTTQGWMYRVSVRERYDEVQNPDLDELYQTCDEGAPGAFKATYWRA